MKIQNIRYLLIFFIFNLNSNNLKESISYILKVDFPKSIKNIPNLCAYYKGYAINFDDNICLVRQDNYINQLILVITPEINHKSQGNNIKYLERLESKPCRVFYITNKIDLSKLSSGWYFQEENIDNLPLRLPECSLVLLMDPTYVEKLALEEEHEISKNSYGTLINLPKVVIRKDVNNDDIIRSMNYVWLSAFDIRAIHTKIKTYVGKSTKDNQEVIASIKALER